mgnify:CR=1 FL=1
MGRYAAPKGRNRPAESVPFPIKQAHFFFRRTRRQFLFHGTVLREGVPVSITVSDMQEYGYSWDGMLPLKEEAALHLYEKEDMQIFLLHEDGSESIPENTGDIKAHAEKGGIFGVHKEDWNRYRFFHSWRGQRQARFPAIALKNGNDNLRVHHLLTGILLENPLKAAELSTEQNANMIDGVINNTPNTDTLEAQANAGEQMINAALA